MRIRTLLLPATPTGEQPFALIVDRCDAMDPAEHEMWAEFGRECGAASTLATGDDVELERTDVTLSHDDRNGHVVQRVGEYP